MCHCCRLGATALPLDAVDRHQLGLGKQQQPSRRFAYHGAYTAATLWNTKDAQNDIHGAGPQISHFTVRVVQTTSPIVLRLQCCAMLCCELYE